MKYQQRFAAAAMALAVLAAIPGTAEARAGSQGSAVKPGNDKVIVVLRKQFTGLPDTPGGAARRSAVVAASQRGVLAELTAAHARAVKPISLVNAVAAIVSPAVASRLAANPAVAEVMPDQQFAYGSPAPQIGAPNPRRPVKPLPGACPARKNAVQLDPEAIEAIHAASQSGRGAVAQALGVTGSGVKVAFIADGADPDNPDFIRANGQHVFVDNEDFSGTGADAPTDASEAFLDASSIAAQGRHVYNVAGYEAKLTVPCRIRVLGVAPGASLVDLNVFGSSVSIFTSVFLEAIDYAVTRDHVNVINESFGFAKFPDTDTTDLIERANDAAVKAGVTVTVSSGDSGVTNTIGSPASDPRVITVGATTTYRSYAQTDFAGTITRQVKGWIDNNISGLSSGGFTQTGTTVDVVAPGDLNWALCTPNTRRFFGCASFRGRPSPVELEGGTSESAPLTAGVAALVIQAYEQGHHGHRPTPALVKRIIVSTAQDIGAPAEQQGAGMIDAYKAVLAARSYPGSAAKAKAGHAVVASVTQFNAVGARSAKERFVETLTNAGQGPVTVHLSGRALSPYTTIASKTLHLTHAGKYAMAVKIHVACGTARLNVSLALFALVNLTLIAPDGDLAAYNLPQGFSNFANAQVSDPAKGTWTAVISAFPLDSPRPLPVKFLAQTARWRSFGKLSVRSLTLARGASRRFSLTASTPSAPGDRSGAIVLSTVGPAPTFARQTTIPVTLRSVAPTSIKFKGTVTGGNGRGQNTGQASYYEIDVKPGTRALNATISTALRFGPVFGELVNPSGLVQSAASSPTPPKPGRPTGTELHVLRPDAGRWTLIVDFVDPVSGRTAMAPFTVSIDDHAVRATQTGLPTSAHAMLPGKPVIAHLRITNNSPFPQEYFVDARHGGLVRLPLLPLVPARVRLPDLVGRVPTYLVPSLTNSLSAKVTAPARNFFGLSWAFGDPDVISSTGKTSAVTFAGRQIPAGFWMVAPYLVGPDGKKRQKQVRAQATMTALTAPFDPAISSPTGDLWLLGTKKKATLVPRTVRPGQTITIAVRIDPKGAAGSVISGTIYLSSLSRNSVDLAFDPLLDRTSDLAALLTASNVAAFHYAYTIAP